MTRHRLVFTALLLALSAAVPARAQTGMLVMPFENVSRDGRIFWLGEAAAVLLTDDLNALGSSAFPRQERRQAFARLQVPPAAALTDATLIRIGQVVGAAQVIVGTLQFESSVLVVRARRIALDTGRVQQTVSERGPITDLFATFERIARQIADAPKASESAQLEHPSFDVFANFIKGLLAETPQTAVSYLWAALRQQPEFLQARLALWDVYASQGDYGHALDAVDSMPLDSSYGRRAEFLAGLACLELGRYEQAFKAFDALAKIEPTPTVMNNLGVVQLRRGGTPQTGVPVYFFNKATENDQNDPDYMFNLGYAYWVSSRDPQAAMYWLREAVRRNRADADAHFVLSAALGAIGNASEAARERELARRLSSAYDSLDRRRPGSLVDGVPKGLERVKRELEPSRTRTIETRLAENEHRDQEELAKFHLDRGRRLFQQESDRDASIELDRALYLSPYLGEAHLLLGRIHLRNGRLREAIDAFKISLWSAETAAVHVALGEAYRQSKDLASARAEAERALAIDPASADARQLLARIDGR